MRIKAALAMAPMILAAIILSPAAFATRTVITATTAPGRYPTAGTAVSVSAADTTNLNRFLFTGDGRDALLVVNGGATVTVSVTSVSDSSLGGRTGSIVAETMTPWQIKIFGPFAGVGWRQSSDGYIWCEASTTSVTFCHIKLP